jgi:hypothetical protein
MRRHLPSLMLSDAPDGFSLSIGGPSLFAKLEIRTPRTIRPPLGGADAMRRIVQFPYPLDWVFTGLRSCLSY